LRALETPSIGQSYRAHASMRFWIFYLLSGATSKSAITS
jgi:hypothetical protein